MNNRFKSLYTYMLENGELKKAYRSMTGNWEADQEKFIEAQIKLEKVVGFTDEQDTE